jgi:hypothetical protein
MQGSRPPHPPQDRPPHPQGSQQGERRGGNTNTPPLLTDRDRQLLGELLDNDEQAQALFGTLQSAPPELAALGFLMLRIFERTRST